jgi:hypothetical protein
MRIKNNDNSIPALDKYIDEQTGFLHVKGILARTGVQEYLGRELSPKLEPDQVYGVLRDKEDVLDEESLNGYRNAPVTDDHPSDFVTSDNYKELSKGSTSEVSVERKDGIDYIQGHLTVMDKELIEKLRDGKLEISMGYASDIQPEEGEFLGTPYQFRQRDIKINHAAIVSKGRCGGRCRIVSDSGIITDEPQNKGELMKKITINGVEYEVPEEVYNEFMKMNKDMEGKEKEMETMSEDMEEVEKEKEKAVATADELQERIKGMSQNTNDSHTVEHAKKLVAVKTIADSMKIDVKLSDEMTMKKEVLASKYPDLTLDGKSNEYIDARFDVMVEGRKAAKESQKQIADGARENNQGSLSEKLEDKDY